MTESATTVVTRNSDSNRTICNFPLITWLNVRHVFNENFL